MDSQEVNGGVITGFLLPGLYDLEVINSDGQVSTLEDAVLVCAVGPC